MKTLIVLGCVLALLLTMVGCSDNPDTVLGNDSPDEVQSKDGAASATASETGYAEKPPKCEMPEPGTGP